MYVFVENESFCTACMHTFALIKENPTQITINKIVQSMLSLLQRCTTPLICTCVAYYAFNFLPESDNASKESFGNIVVTGAVFVLSWLMTLAFAQVYEQVVQALTVCVLHDLREYGGRFIRRELREAFGLAGSSTDAYHGGKSSMM